MNSPEKRLLSIRLSIVFVNLGSSSANFHVISPASKGLFQRAIMSSGSVLNPWSYTDQNHISVLYNLGEMNGGMTVKC